ncbi:hypothetical protein FPQ18DRAFT_309319 [Pyronema domesticum]|nr:hypothetical protein FPQ18DRAFT_309319 [Pyronema domesticum]
MMEIISIVALFINAVAAAPPLPPGVSRNTVINWDRPFHGGILGGVYYCDDIKWGKTCLYGAYELAKCHDVPNNWNDIISSFGPDKGTYCFVYEKREPAQTRIQRPN